ncbi:MAG: trypsin-like peptidase domain-containing protein [Thiobacillus sp.]|nr:trypsin-like peptidase domain-containing protein [Thiobacillus sp.]
MLTLASLLALWLAGTGLSFAARQPAWDTWVLKVDVIRNDGTRDLGSGVLIGPERLITNCHVVRNAREIRVSQGQDSWLASPVMGDAYRDLCLLRLPGHPGNPPPIAEPGSLKVGQAVYAAGYSGGTFGTSTGRVKGLFTCDCDGGKVIQTSAQFEPGASGGGLFNEAGELVGILTFKSHSGGIFHFAIPIGWMKQLSQRPLSDRQDREPFWENPSRSSGYFLAACDLSAKKKWQDLLQLTQEWERQEPYNPQAWMASGRANLGLKRLHRAARDFQKVLELDSTHAEAQWELQQLELELGQPLPGS